MIPAILFPKELHPRLIQQGLLVPEPAHLQLMTAEQAMKLAIQEAYKGLGFTSPNPLVGCVILDSKDRFLSKGYHARLGQAHAEINALNGLKTEDLQGAKVYVTLEPCAHEGRTPSCAKTLAKLPIAEVIYGLKDPNPLVAGQGAEILRQAWIAAMEYPGLKKELEEVCEHFLWNFREKKVFVSAKVASSLDGQLAMANGESKWITDDTSREVSHILRAAHDAIMVGANTVVTDNPSLNVRASGFQEKRIKLIILDSDALCLAGADKLRLAKIHDPSHVYFAISDQISDPPNPWGAQVIRLPAKGLGLDLDLLLTKLWDLGTRSLFVEGGAHVLSSIISERKAQRLYLFQAPMILGAKSGKAWTEQVSISSMGGRIALANQQFITLSRDLFFTGTLN